VLRRILIVLVLAQPANTTRLPAQATAFLNINPSWSPDGRQARGKREPAQS
jgi:hypothetical protein